jgi:pantoate--beta-alanine ligase
MQRFDQPADVRAWSDAARARGEVVGLVPTMGALHDGHVSLIKLASQRCDHVAVSIFVNPLQFNRPDDFETYPRTLDDDLATCQAVGVDAVYAPTPATMYPRRFQTHVDPGPLAETMEGAARPGHFRGVTTVVTKLLTAVRPDVAVFGEKDFQQLTIIRRMVEDLDLGLEIVAAPTVREPDGLAMSSRNSRLSPDDRIAARCVPAALAAVADAAAGGERDVARLLGAARDVIGGELRARLDYVSVFDPETLEPLEHLDGPARVAIAVWFGDVRLIDNRAL